MISRRDRCLMMCALACLSLGGASCASAQSPAVEQLFFWYRDVELPVTQPRREMLQAIEERHNEVIQPRRQRLYDAQQKSDDELRTLQNELRDAESALHAEMDVQLTPAQWSLIAANEKDELRRQLEQDAKFLNGIGKFTSSFVQTDAFVLYEGLPHPVRQELYQQELREKKTVHLERFAFYAETQTPRQADFERLRRLAADYRSYLSYGGPKFCGGFHPDWAIEWKADDQVYRLFLCFGCHEGHFVGPHGDLWVDLQESTLESFARSLSAYGKNNPEPTKVRD